MTRTRELQILSAAALAALLLAFGPAAAAAPGQTDPAPVLAHDAASEAAAAPGPWSGGTTGLLDGAAARRVLAALRAAYPERIDAVEFRDGDWALRVRGEWFWWARGRLLPQDDRKQWERYDPLPFYAYPRDLPPIGRLSEEERARIEALVKRREENPPRRHSGFLDTLWRITDRESSWQRVKTTYFLGIRTMIHRELLEDLAAVEEEIQEGMKHDPELKDFVGSLRKLDGYNFRRIDGTSSLSFHSYGAAIDIIPQYYGGRHVYWRWAMNQEPEWYSLPYERRFMPPPSFVRAFERQGFVWGGKWRFFDTIHFEYRPEILILNGLLPVP